MQHWNFSKDREQSKSEYIRGLLNLTLLQNTKYEISLLFKKRAMPIGLNNEHHITVCHCMAETNHVVNKTPMCCYNNYKK